MASIKHFLQLKLKLKVNNEKSAVARPWERKFLGFSFSRDRQPKRRIAPKAAKAAKRFKHRVRGTDEPDEERERRANDRGPEPLLAGMDRLLREVSNAIGVGRT